LDAQGISDVELMDEVGWALWERCDSILTATKAHHGQVGCPVCGEMIERQNPWSEGEIIRCAKCAWQMPWAAYHQSYRSKQLFGANAVSIFEAYHQAFPKANSANMKILLIDQLIHAFHFSLTTIGRPAAANLIEGSLKEVIRFLDQLTGSVESAAGIGDSHAAWRKTLEAADWAGIFLESDGKSE
jgi:predicted RNA-binding Zn-ribbon protein involved in translation (DUF1610 family)